jgi:hypothetical protein
MTTATQTRRRLTTAEMVSAAFHEAAHAVGVVLHGGTIERCEVFEYGDGHGHAGATTHSGDLDSTGQVFTSAFGPWADARFSSGNDPSWRDLCEALAASHEDAEAITAGGNRGFPRHLESQFRTLWPTIADLAHTMMVERDKPVLTDADVRAALGIAADGSNCAVVRSMVAAGFAPSPGKAAGQLWTR